MVVGVEDEGSRFREARFGVWEEVFGGISGGLEARN